MLHLFLSCKEAHTRICRHDHGHAKDAIVQGAKITSLPAAGATAGDEDIDEADDRSFLQAVHSPKPPMLALPAGPHQSRQQQETAVQTLPVALSSLSPEASVTQV